MKDPQFGRDVGFYVFDLPALRFFYGWLMGLAIVTTLAVAGLYLFRFLTFGPDEETANQSRRHLALLLAIVVALFIWRYWLNRFELNFSDERRRLRRDLHRHPCAPAVHLPRHGAGRPDLAGLAGSGCRTQHHASRRHGMVFWAVVTAIGGIVLPATPCSVLQVQPNELEKERAVHRAQHRR